MNSDKLLENILSIPSLKEAVDEIVNKTGALNLVTLDWKKVLEESPVVQKHLKKEVKYSKVKESNNVSVKNLYNMDDQFNIVVPGFWILDLSESKHLTTSVKSIKKSSSDSIVCLKSEPLAYIGMIMGKHKEEKLSDNCRFYIKSCEPAGCNVCGNFKKKVKKSYKNMWCIKFTKIHDGEKIKHSLRSTVVKTFGQGKCMGILHLTVRQYLMYGDGNFKIGGECNDMILFNDIFHEMKDLNMDHLIDEEEEDSTTTTQVPLEGVPHKAKE